MRLRRRLRLRISRFGAAPAAELADLTHPLDVRHQVRVLFLTARADMSDHERSRTTGAVGHVTKPFNPSSLGDEIRAALTR